MDSSTNFYDIISKEKWQDFQDHFAGVLGLTLTTIDREGAIVAKVSTPRSLPKEIQQTLASIVIQEKENFSQEDFAIAQKRWQDGITSKTGFYYFLLPMRVADVVCAYVVVGPVCIGKGSFNCSGDECAGLLSLDREVFSQAVNTLKSFSFYEITATIDLIFDVATYTLQLEYQNKTLRKLTPGSTEVLKKIYGWYSNKLLGVLLDIALDITRAERGSLMLLDEEKNELFIKEARGIAADIVAKTRIKYGEGIAGIVAQEGKSLILDNTVTDSRIRSLFHKPEINSAIALPFTINNRIKGVLNVASTQQTEQPFSSREVESLDRLIKLFEMTIGDLSKLATN